jgi:hypothetical protein
LGKRSVGQEAESGNGERNAAEEYGHDVQLTVISSPGRMSSKAVSVLVRVVASKRVNALSCETGVSCACGIGEQLTDLGLQAWFALYTRQITLSAEPLATQGCR